MHPAQLHHGRCGGLPSVGGRGVEMHGLSQEPLEYTKVAAHSLLINAGFRRPALQGVEGNDGKIEITAQLAGQLSRVLRFGEDDPDLVSLDALAQGGEIFRRRTDVRDLFNDAGDAQAVAAGEVRESVVMGDDETALVRGERLANLLM